VAEPEPTTSTPADRAFAVAWGVMLSLCVTGYTFGQSNHHVYLLDALRIAEPEALARDWFTNNTLQYHFLYTWLVLALQKVRLLQAGFFILYLGLAVAMHVAWLAIVRRIGAGLRTYLLSTLLYHLSAGGLGLGVYQFLQDGSFLPSNISAVATLAAIAFWLNRRLWATSGCVAVAGLFHVNYALALIGFWGLLSLATLREVRPLDRRSITRYALAAAIAMTPCFYNVAVAAIGALKQTSKVPLDEFVNVYVRLRHEHHHDPLHWPLALWISFLWPIPFAFAAMRSLPRTIATPRLNLLLVVVLVMLVFAFTFAGVWFVSDKIVQLSLFRFSIFAKLITCVYAARWIVTKFSAKQIACAAGIAAVALVAAIPLRHRMPTSIPQPQLGLLIGASVLCSLFAYQLISTKTSRWRTGIVLGIPICLFLASRQQLGIAMPGEDDPDMTELALWARGSTPPSALFLTPPHDATFTLAAHRSSVVGFKQVPQLSGELVEWKRRLDDVLDEDIESLPRPLPRTLDAMAARYQALPAEHLQKVAAEFGCDYIIAMADLGRPAAHVTPGRRYYVYRSK
jgi:hypothetical protein